MADEFEATGGIDPASIAADLFPSSGGPSSGGSEAPDAGAGIVSPAPSASPSGPSTPVPAAAPANVTQAEWDALPKAWKKEMEAEWKTASPALRQYAHERERQVMQGIGQYRSGAENWSKVTAPFQQILAQYPNANPAEILSTLAANHLQMVQATPEQRVQHALALARGYGVDLTVREARAAVAAQDAGGAPQGGYDPADFTPKQMERIQAMLQPVVGTVQQNAEFINKQRAQEVESAVDKFFSDPKNEFANEVGNDILEIIQSGQTNDLATAYELAVLRNPEVKAKYLAKLLSTTQPPPPPPPLPNVKSSATPIRKATPATMDDTMAEVIKKHYPT